MRWQISFRMKKRHKNDHEKASRRANYLPILLWTMPRDTSQTINKKIYNTQKIQYWGQPFVSKGKYIEFKYITDPLAKNYQDRFHLYANDMITQSESDGTYYIDENADGIKDYSFGNPDFNFLQFGSNLVMRWQYKPGSEFFLVWTQSTYNSADPDKPIFDTISEDLFCKKIDNIFLLKFTYRFINS